MSLLGISAFLHADLVKTTLLVHLCEDRHPVFLIIVTIILRQRGNFVNYHLQIVVDNDGLLLLGIETLEHLHLSLSVEPAINTIHYNEELLNYNTETADNLSLSQTICISRCSEGQSSSSFEIFKEDIKCQLSVEPGDI